MYLIYNFSRLFFKNFGQKASMISVNKQKAETVFCVFTVNCLCLYLILCANANYFHLLLQRFLILSDIQKIAELFQSSVCLMCKHTFCKNLTKLYAFLVKAVYVPYKSLEHDLVLKVCQKRSKSLRCQ